MTAGYLLTQFITTLIILSLAYNLRLDEENNQ